MGPSLTRNIEQEHKNSVTENRTTVMAISAVLSNNRPATLRERVSTDFDLAVSIDGRVYSVLVLYVKSDVTKK